MQLEIERGKNNRSAEREAREAGRLEREADRKQLKYSQKLKAEKVTHQLKEKIEKPQDWKERQTENS